MTTTSESWDWESFFENCGIEGPRRKKYAKKFRGEQIRQNQLPKLTEQHLRDLGVNTLGDRLAIMDYVRESDGKLPADESAKYSEWAKQISPRVLYTPVEIGGECRKHCVTPLSKDFALTYYHGSHRIFKPGASLKICADAEDNPGFGVSFKAKVLACDDGLDVILLKAPIGRQFTKEDLSFEYPRVGTDYIMIGFSNPDDRLSSRVSRGTIMTTPYKAAGGLMRFYGSSGSFEGDSGAGCWDRNGRLLGIQVAVSCTEVHQVEKENEKVNVVQLNGGKAAIIPAAQITWKFDEYLPNPSSGPIIE